MTCAGKYPFPSTRENCPAIEVTDNDIKNSVRTITKVNTLVRIMPNFTILFLKNNTTTTTNNNNNNNNNNNYTAYNNNNSNCNNIVNHRATALLPFLF